MKIKTNKQTVDVFNTKHILETTVKDIEKLKSNLPRILNEHAQYKRGLGYPQNGTRKTFQY